MCNLCDELLVEEQNALRQTSWRERRVNALGVMGVGSFHSAIMEDLDNDQVRNLRYNTGAGRGATSVEADMINEANRKYKRDKRAISLGFTSEADRYEVDIDFHVEMTRHGRTFHDMEIQDLVTNFHLANPPRDRVQIALGTGGGGTRAGRRQGFVWRLAFIATTNVASLPQTSKRHFGEPWAIMYHTSIWSLEAWSKLVSRYDVDCQAVVTWDGVEWTRAEHATQDILDAARRSYDRAANQVQAKVRQSTAACAKAAADAQEREHRSTHFAYHRERIPLKINATESGTRATSTPAIS